MSTAARVEVAHHCPSGFCSSPFPDLAQQTKATSPPLQVSCMGNSIENNVQLHILPLWPSSRVKSWACTQSCEVLARSTISFCDASGLSSTVQIWTSAMPEPWPSYA